MTDNIQLLLYDQSDVEYDISYIDEIPISLNFLISDINRPDKRNSSFSKTINLPGTNEINDFFKFHWRTNISFNYFDPNLKCRIIYKINGVEYIKGYIQLLEMSVDDLTQEVNYEISIVGELGDFFKAIGDLLLTDLNFSQFDHVLNKTNITDSWSTQIVDGLGHTPFTLGYGYVYPLIDWGLNGGNNTEHHVKHFRPAIYKKMIWDILMTQINWSYSSSYLTSTYYKSLVIPPTNPNDITLTQSEINNSQFYAARTSTQIGTAQTCSYSGAWNTGISGTAGDVVIFTDDSTLPYNDAGAQYNTGTGEFIVANTNVYTVASVVNFSITFTNSLGTAAYHAVNTGSVTATLRKYDGSPYGLPVATNSYFFTPTGTQSGLTTKDFQISVLFPGVTLNAGEKYKVYLKFSAVQFTLYTGALAIISTGVTTAKMNYKANSVYYANLDSTVITEGYTLSMNKVLPINTKVVDWIMNEIYLGNLLLELDKTTPNKIIIETREDFYTGNLDWTNKRDYSKKRKILPMGSLDWKRYDFTYKQDNDYYNKLYFDEYQEVYGYGYYEIQNDFLVNKQKKELIYSATPTVGNNINGLVISKIYQIDNGIVKPIKTNLRHLYYGGEIALSFGSWTLKSALSGDTVYTTYPYAGDTDNPYTPTLTINWDTPKKIYYLYPSGTYTDNNLKNRYYDKMIKQITDKVSKIEIRHYVLNPFDIKNFSFRKIIFDTDAYFLVNNIKDYDILKSDSISTPVELLKLTDYDAYTPVSFSPPPSDITVTERIIGGASATKEDNNVNLGTASKISGGTGNYISAGATGVELTNCTNVIVNSDVVGFIGVGLSDTTITSDSNNRFNAGDKFIVDTYNGSVFSPAIGVETKTSDFTVDGSVSFYLIDTSANDVTATFLSDLTNNKQISFKVIAGTKDFYIDNDVSGTVDGRATPFNTSLITWGYINVISIGTDIYIK